MKVKEIEVTYGVTRNMGNYESLRLDYTMRVQLDNVESTTKSLFEVRNELRERVLEGVNEEVRHLHGSDRPKRRG